MVTRLPSPALAPRTRLPTSQVHRDDPLDFRCLLRRLSLPGPQALPHPPAGALRVGLFPPRRCVDGVQGHAGGHGAAGPGGVGGQRLPLLPLREGALCVGALDGWDRSIKLLIPRSPLVLPRPLYSDFRLRSTCSRQSSRLPQLCWSFFQVVHAFFARA